MRTANEPVRAFQSGLRTTVIAMICLMAIGTCPMALADGAGVTVMAWTEEAAVLKVTAASGATRSITLQPDASGGWRAIDAGQSPGVIFGPSALRMAGPARLRGQGVAPSDALRLVSQAIGDAACEDVSVVRTYDGGQIVICLWRDGSIAEMWGTAGWIEVLIAAGDLLGRACDRAQELCCQKSQSADDGQEPQLPCEGVWFPDPRIDSCVAAASGCGGVWKQQACACLFAAVAVCEGTANCCDELPWVLEINERAVPAWLMSPCNPNIGPEDPLPPGQRAVQAVIDAIIDRAQVILDTQAQ